MKEQLLAVLEAATQDEYDEGLAWYQNAHDFCRELAKEYKVRPIQAASVISIISPRNKWEKNKLDAKNFFKFYAEGLDLDNLKISTFGSNKQKAFDYLSSNLDSFHSSGFKTICFADNINNPKSSERVTLDTWMFRLYYWKNITKNISSPLYLKIEKEFQNFASDLKLKPHQLQAISWVTIKRLYEENKKIFEDEPASILEEAIC